MLLVTSDYTALIGVINGELDRMNDEMDRILKKDITA
jgi:hypothetical protein